MSGEWPGAPAPRPVPPGRSPQPPVRCTPRAPRRPGRRPLGWPRYRRCPRGPPVARLRSLRGCTALRSAACGQPATPGRAGVAGVLEAGGTGPSETRLAGVGTSRPGESPARVNKRRVVGGRGRSPRRQLEPRNLSSAPQGLWAGRGCPPVLSFRRAPETHGWFYPRWWLRSQRPATPASQGGTVPVSPQAARTREEEVPELEASGSHGVAWGRGLPAGGAGRGATAPGRRE